MPSYAAKNYPAGRPQSRPGPRRPLRRHLWRRLIASSSEKTRAPLIRASNELVVNGAKASPWAPPVAPGSVPPNSWRAISSANSPNCLPLQEAHALSYRLLAERNSFRSVADGRFDGPRCAGGLSVRESIVREGDAIVLSTRPGGAFTSCRRAKPPFRVFSARSIAQSFPSSCSARCSSACYCSSAVRGEID
jgi:hypothetical protein